MNRDPNSVVVEQDMHLTEREFAWTQADFQRVKALIYERAGISLHDGKQAMVYSRLARRLRETGFQSFQSYLAWLERQDQQEWQEFVNALTTNLTAFFRERHHFEVLFQYLRRRQVHGPTRIWCSAASTGEEPYSIAMTAVEALGPTPNVKVIASDIDSKVLATATRGVYRLDGLRGLGQEQVRRFFMRGTGANEGLVRVKSELRQLIEFVNINLVRDGWPIADLFDVVFCRNVMIYFDFQTQRQVLERIHRVMKPGALLFVGHAENFSDARDIFVLQGKTVYERC